MITLSAARLILQDPDRLPALLDELEEAPAADLDALAPLVFDVICMKDRSLSLMALTRIIALRPDWVNKIEAPWHATTPLIRAVKERCLPTVSFLLDAGARPQDSDTAHLNALDYAARKPCHPCNQAAPAQICEVLLERGGFTPKQKDLALYFAGERANLAQVNILLAHGADFTHVTQKGTALGAACMVSESDSPVLEIVRAMLQTSRGRQVINLGWGHPDEGYGGHGAPIHCAAYRGNLKVLSVLLAAGAWLNPPPDYPRASPTTPLMSAAQRVRLETIEFLLAAGADSGLVNAVGHNVLHHLADSDHDPVPASATALVKTVDLLLSGGADPLAEDTYGVTPQDAARLNKKNPLLSDHLDALLSARSLSSGTTDSGRPLAAAGPRL